MLFWRYDSVFKILFDRQTGGIFPVGLTVVLDGLNPENVTFADGFLCRL